MDNPEIVSLRSIIDDELGHPNIFFDLNLCPEAVNITKDILCSHERIVDCGGGGRMMNWILNIEDK
jgi:hypothetical protein